jgi:hypothetical protein
MTYIPLIFYPKIPFLVTTRTQISPMMRFAMVDLSRLIGNPSLKDFLYGREPSLLNKLKNVKFFKPKFARSALVQFT